tara:strand:+ start:113 stop:355 length:243 start_codon:yes stop_codon:yes gene_type:complete
LNNFFRQNASDTISHSFDGRNIFTRDCNATLLRLSQLKRINWNNLEQLAEAIHHAILAFFRLLQQVKFKGLCCKNNGPNI